MRNSFIASTIAVLLCQIASLNAQTYSMPSEELEHEGTWLQWPHQFEYGVTYRNRLDATWVAMTQALVAGEKVHIIAYNTNQQTRITDLLADANVPLDNIDFYIYPTNDVWVRDNGPIFVKDENGNLAIEDWGFNGWGGDYNFELCDPIPTSVANALSLPLVNLNSVMINEGGAVEIDGHGVLMATRSSILSQSNQPGVYSIRNPNMTEAEAEDIFSQYLGISKFIWLDGYFSDLDITDAHIDGFARFANGNTIVTMSDDDLSYWGLSNNDISTLFNATDINNVAYNFTTLPLTQNDVTTTYGFNLGFKGSYVNYYVANTVVLVPNYNDPNDEVANAIIQELYPNRTVIGIDCRNLYEYGGMVHCVTQQQPFPGTIGLFEPTQGNQVKIFPNPFNAEAVIQLSLPVSNGNLHIYNSTGQQVALLENLSGSQFIISKNELQTGIYYFEIHSDYATIRSRFMVVD